MTPPRPHLPPPNGQMPPQVAPGMEMIQPVPMSFTMWPVPNSGPAGETAVVMRIASVHGPLHFILSDDEAIQVGGRLRQLGKAAKTGLTLPPNAFLGESTDEEADPTIDEVAGGSELATSPGPGVVHRITTDPKTHPGDCTGCTEVTWYLAICVGGCQPVLPTPFRDLAERDGWATAHQEATGHKVERDVERRGDTTEHDYAEPAQPSLEEPPPIALPVTKDPKTHPQDCVGPGGLPCRQDGDHDYRGAHG